MAQSDGQERTEDATPKRREEALKEGRVPRSQELSAATLLIAGTTTLALAGGATLARHAVVTLQAGTGWLTAVPMTVNGAVTILQQVGQNTLLALAPFFGAVMAITLLVNAIQARGVISTEALGPKLSHIDPIAGMGRIFSAEALFNLFKALVKLAVIGCVAWGVLHHAWNEILSTSGAGVEQVLGVTRELAIRMALFVGLVFLAIAAVDYGFQVWQFEKSLRMTKQEVMQEHRESEGDPAGEGPHPPAAEGDGAEADAHERGDRGRGGDQPDAHRRRAQVRPARLAGTGGPRDGRATAGQAHPRDCHARRSAGHREQAPGAGALRHRQGRHADSAGPLRGSRRSHRLRLPAQGYPVAGPEG